MITVIFWSTMVASSCVMVKLAVEIHTLNARIKKMDACVKYLRNYNSPSS
jgi:hypothetical protein